MGQRAAELAARHLREAVAQQGPVRVAFAAAPSQNEFLAALRQDKTVPWAHMSAFQLDEYIGLPEDAPQRFKAYLDEHLFRNVAFKEVHYLEAPGLSPEEACRRYEALLGEDGLELVCLGIGENGHLAFNDPPVADFADPQGVKIVDLDELCRQQQVNDGCFTSLDEVPRQAVTLTLPTIMKAKRVVCVVPGERKNRAVRQALYGPISPACPASILRLHPNASLFLDSESAEGVAVEAVHV